MDLSRVIQLLLFLCTIEGYLQNFCYYSYEPLFEANQTIVNYQILAETNDTKLNISVNGGNMEELLLCNKSDFCCWTLFQYSTVNATVNYRQLCTETEIQLYATSLNGSTYQSPSTKQLGKDYFVACPFDKFQCSFVIGFVEENANVTVKFLTSILSYIPLMNANESVTTNEVSFILTQDQMTVDFRCECDLTGVSVYSNATVTVFSVVHHNRYSITMFPLPPVDLLDTEYSIVAMDDAYVDEAIIMVTSTVNTFLKVEGLSTVNFPYAGSFFSVPFNKVVFHVKASRPVLVLHVGRFINMNDKSIINIYPLQNNSQMCLHLQAATTTLFFISPNDTTGSVYVQCKESVTNDTNSTTTTVPPFLERETYIDVDGITYIVSKTVINPNDRDCQVSTAGSSNGYAVVQEADGIKLFSIGNFHNAIEIDYSLPSSLYNTDIKDNTADSFGTYFVVWQPENSTLLLFISCLNVTKVTVRHVMQPANSMEDQLFFCNNTSISYSVDINIVSNNIENLAVESDSEISVYVTSFTTKGIFSYLALPVNILGYEYIVVSYLNVTNVTYSQRSCCYITALYNGTNINIAFRPEVKAVVYYANDNDASEKSVHLNEYQTFQFESKSDDLTGTYLKSNKPIALYCGGDSKRSIYYEQMLPINTLGLKFTLKYKPNLNVFAKCFFRLVATDIDSKLELNYTGIIVSHNVSRGEYMDLNVEQLEVTSNLGLIAALVCVEEYGDILFSLIPSQEQRRSSPVLPTDDRYEIIKGYNIVVYKNTTSIAAHASAMTIKTIACPFDKTRTDTLDTSGCFNSGGGGGVRGGSGGGVGVSTSATNTGCLCICVTTLSNVTLAERLEILAKELTIDKTTLSSYRNARMSAPDDRPSSRGIGSLAAALIATLIFVIVMSDVSLLILHLKLLKNNLCGRFPRK